jgi:3-oxoacyl-[acyl-carrier-protein] synthase II
VLPVLTRDLLAVRGLGLRLPGVLAPGDLVRQISGAVPPPRTRRQFDAAGTDLEPIDRWIHGPTETRMPPGVTARGLRALPHESLLGLAAAAEAATASARTRTEVEPGPAAVVWASSTAGLPEYATICVEAALLEPGLSSPIIGPASAFNALAAIVSIRLGLHGPNETLTGGTTAGISALVEAGRFLFDSDATSALVGASASVSRWSLAGPTGTHDPAEGAACLVVEPWRTGDTGIGISRCRRIGLDPARLVAQAREFVRAPTQPAALVVSASDPALVEALAKDQSGPVWQVESALGEYGAAGGFMAAVSAVAYCTTVAAPTTIGVLAVEPSGNATIMEVSSR